jgi:hypothetical protein
VKVLFSILWLLFFSILPYKAMSNESINIPKEWFFQAGLSFYAQSIAGDRTEAQIAGTALSLLASHRINPKLHIFLDASLRLENGSHKSLDIEEFTPEQQVLLNNAEVNYRPVSWLELQVGSLNQEHFKSPLFIESTAFVAARETARYIHGKNSFYVSIQQAIPNNQNLSERLGSIDQGTPSLFTETLGHRYNGDLFNSDFGISSFGFRNLSNSVAHQSRFMGNSVIGIGQDAAEFNYKYQGINAHLELWMALKAQWSLSLRGHWTKNRKAPDARSNAQWAELSLNFKELSFKGQFIHSESDASVAFYNNKFLGHNNVKGFGLGVELRSPWGHLNLDAVQTRPIRYNIFQERATVVMLGLNQQLGSLGAEL